MTDKAPAFPLLPFLLKILNKIYLQLSTDMSAKIAFALLTHTESFSFLGCFSELFCPPSA